MPGYAGSGQATLCRYNEQKFFWNAEVIAPGALSAAFELNRTTGTYYPWGFSVELIFSGAPGTFEVDVMGSDTDTAATYVKLGAISAVNANQAARFEGISYWPKFVALNMVTLTNGSVSITAKLTR